MCEFCTKHGEGKIWYKNTANYSQDLLSDLNRRRYIEHFHTEAFGEGFKTLGRLEAIYRKKGKLPDAVKAAMLKKSKAEHFGQVLPIEEIGELVGKAKTVVRMPCACRWAIGKKDERCCYAVSYGPEAWYRSIDMGYFGLAANEGLESLTSVEAVGQMQAMEGQGRIHTIWTMMTPFIGAICNCRPEDCLAMLTISRTAVETMQRAEFVAVVDDRRCTGCGLCDTECHFGAIGSHNHHGTSHAHVDPAKCFGCGLCRRVCAAEAITMQER